MNKIFAVVALIGVITLGAVSFASAQNTTSTTTSTDSGRPVKVPANKVEIAPSGEVNLTGSVVSVSGNSIAVKSWGGIWNVGVASDTVMAGMGVKIDVSKIQIGDTIGIHGKMSADSGLNLQAKVIRDYSSRNNNATSTVGKVEKSEDVRQNQDNPGFWGKIMSLFGRGRGSDK